MKTTTKILISYAIITFLIDIIFSIFSYLYTNNQIHITREYFSQIFNMYILIWLCMPLLVIFWKILYVLYIKIFNYTEKNNENEYTKNKKINI